MTKTQEPKAPPDKHISQSLPDVSKTASGNSRHDPHAALNATRHDAWRDYICKRGKRYEDCRIGNFVTAGNEKDDIAVDERLAIETKLIAASDKVREFIDNIRTHYHNGDNLIFFGPRGTGKDHLLTAVIHAAIGRCSIEWEVLGEPSLRCPRVEWTNGARLFGDMRDSLNVDSERSFVATYAKADILAISDPIPPAGNLTDFQQAVLYRILDERYSNRRPTWVTVNVKSGAELDKQLGPLIADRLREGATAVFCNWESYREIAK